MISSLLFNVITILIVLVGVAITALYLFFQKKFKYWSDRNVPHAKPSFPFGNLNGVKDNAIGVIFKKIYDEGKHHRYYGFWQMHLPVISINDPDLIKRVLVGDFMNFHDHGIYFNEADDPISANLFALEGTAWRNLRVKLTPTFTSGKMKMMFPILVERGKELQEVLLEHAKVGDIVEVKEYAARFSTDVISSCAFGVEANSLKNPDAVIRKMGRKMFEPNWGMTIKNFIASFTPDLARLIKMVGTPKDVSDFFMKTFKEVVDYRERNNVKRNDAMQLLIDLKNKGYVDDVDNPNKGDDSDKKDSFNFNQLAAQAFIFFVGGFETSATVMQFALYELAKNPDVQTKLRDEIRRVLAKHKGDVTYEAIYEMEYLGRVMDETLRKYSPAPALLRICAKDFKDPDSDLVIEKGTLVSIPVFGLHMDERYFPDPEKFDPDRFTEEQKATRPNYIYLPFGEGPRVCIGQRFGQMQTRVGLISLLTKYKFEISKKHLPEPLQLDPKSFIITPKGGMKLKISLIDD